LVLGWSALAAAAPGNAWHIPGGGEPGIASMRAPFHGVTAGGDVAIYSGNQFAGGGNPGNQLQTGSAVLFRRVGDLSWSTAAMTFFQQSGNNKYFVATIPGSALQAGDTIEYYLKVAYSDHPTTFVFGNDGSSQATVDEGVAQTSAFLLGVDWPLQPAGAFATHEQGSWQARVYTDSGHISLANGATEIALAPSSATIDGSQLSIGRVVAQTALANGFELQQQLGRRTIVSRLTFPVEGVVRYEVIDWGGTAPTATMVSAASDGNEHFYGFGEKFNSLDQAGKVVRIMTADIAGDKGDNSYKVAPWIISSRGYGLHLDASAESVFDMRASLPDRYTAKLAFRTLAVNLVGGPSPRDVLSRFTGYVGRPPLPPPWVFGPWMSSDAWRDGGEVRYVVTRMLEEKLPASVFVFDSPWELAYNDFAWNMTQFGAGGTYEGQFYEGFSSLAEMLTFLRTRGLKVVVWLTPFINVSSYDEGIPGQNLGRAALYDTAAANGYFVRASPGGAPLVSTWWKGDGSPIDFTNPAARVWFQDQLQQLVDASGGVIAGFKTDDGEADYIPLTASYADGRTGVEMKNGYCLEYLRSVWNVLGADGVVFARSGFTGTQAFPAVWAGDNEPNFGAGNGLPSVLVAGLSSAMTGYSIWGHDIGGYQDRNESSSPADLFIRWTQFGAMSPIMQLHRQVSAGKQYPWSYGQAALDNYRVYSQLHTSLFPYLYSYAKQAAADGIPLMRPLPLIDPAATRADQYWLGGELLVAPVLEKDATSRTVDLPAGTGWYDFWTNEHYDGGQTIEWSGSQLEIPLYVRDGAIVPRIAGDIQSLAGAAYVGNPEITTDDGALDLLIYPATTASHAIVYDGTDVTCLGKDGVTTINVSSVARALQLDVYSSAHPVRVTRDGVTLDEVAPADLATITSGWTYDGTSIRIKVTHAGGPTMFVLDGTAGPDDEDDVTKPGGCGCGTAPSDALAGWLLVLVGLVLARRRRR
jgi:alpha-D-xyloside xylohydrolase